MKKRNVLAALVTLGLTTAAVTPALALENEFHGLFSARYINSNFNRTDTTDYGPGDGTYDPSGKSKGKTSANFIEQRARLQYIAKANADLKLVTNFEIDYSYWGNSSYSVGRNQGAALGADSVNIETKHVYLDFNPVKNLNVKVGVQPFTDSFKGLLFDDDAAGVVASSSYKGFTPTVGFFRLSDKNANTSKVLGHKTADLFALDAKYEVSKELKVGGAYFYYTDGQQTGSTTTASNSPSGVLADGTNIYPVGTTFTTSSTANDTKLHILGLNAEYVQGPLTLSGFAIYENGSANKVDISSLAGNVGAKIKAGPGAARAEFLYVAGDEGTSTSKTSAFASISSGFYNNELVILGRDKNAYTTDNSIIFDSGNKGQGQIGGYLGYDLPINDKLSTAFNLGFAAVVKDNAAKLINQKTGVANKSKHLGTEVNAEANYKAFENLTAGVRVGYVVLGDYFKNVASNGTPANPYDAKLIVTYSF